MTDDSSRGPNRREFLVVGGAAAASLAFVASTGMSAAATGCTDGSCSTTTVWMLEPDWGYARGPHAKTRLISRASRGAAANRVARTEADALDMNLHRCSFAPAVAVSVCAPRAEAAFDRYSADWANPWKGSTVSLVDLRWLPDDVDLFACPASTPVGVQSASGGLAWTGGGDRRWLLLGGAAVLAGTIMRVVGGKPRSAETKPRAGSESLTS